jgi:hypothetical protein
MILPSICLPRRSCSLSSLAALSCLAFLPEVFAGDHRTALDPERLGDSKGALIVPPTSFIGGWKFSAGPVTRRVGAVSFNTGSTPGVIPSRFGISSFTAPAGRSADSAYADRTYDDGFVNIGAATPGTGLTTNWGYNSSSQNQGGNLTFSRAGGERRDVYGSSGTHSASWSKGKDTDVGPYLELSYSVPIRKGMTIGAGVSFMSTSIDRSRGGLTTFSQNQTVDVYNVTAVDTYRLGGVIPPLSPYTGSYAGPGPLINNTPDNQSYTETISNTLTANFIDSISEQFDMNLHTLGIGGQMEWWPSPQSFLQAGAGVAVNIADWSASRDERVLQSMNGAAATEHSRQVYDSGGDDILLGFYLQATVGWQINVSWSVQAFGRYDWNESLEGAVSNSTFDVDLNGWSSGISVGYRF